MIKTEGLILKEQSVGESDKLVTVLTKNFLLLFLPLLKFLLTPVLKYMKDGVNT